MREPTDPQSVQPDSLVEIAYRQKLALIVALASTLIVTSSSQTVVATASQNIVADIGGFELFTWMFAGFSLTSAVAVPIIGKLADMHGTRSVMIVSLTLFIVSSTVGGFVNSMEQMIAVRAFQGLGFAGVLSSVWITTAIMWAPKDRAKWLGVLAGAFTLSGVAGPILGGFVSDEISWRWLFWFNLPLGIAALCFMLRIFPKIERAHRSRRLDIAGGLTFGLFATSALLAVTFGGDKYAWDSPIIIGLFLFALLNISLFVRAEFLAEDPVLPPGLFRYRIFAGAMASSLTVTISFVVTTIFVPLLVIGAKGESATTSAFPLMAEAIGIAIGANFAGQILSRFGYARELAVTGLTLTATILWSIGIIGIDISINQLAILSLVMGIGISLAFTSFTVQVQNSMPENVLGVVTTSMQFARTFSMATSSAILGAILLAGIGFINTDDPTPQDMINNPEIIIAERRLADVRLDYLDDPKLGEYAFDQDLSEARKAIGHALSTVFQVAAIGSAVGVLLAVYTFSDMRTEDPD